MPNPYVNSGFEPDESGSGDENLAALGFHTDGDEEELEEDVDDAESASADEENFDLDEDADEVAAPVSGPSLVGSLTNDDEESVEDVEDNEEDLVEEDEETDTDEELTEEIEEVEEDYEEEEIAEDNIIISQSNIVLARQLINSIQKNTARLTSIFSGLLSEGEEEKINLAQMSDSLVDDGDGQVIEGVFNGENMIGPDGKEYSVPANYASKSKLVEGDMLKLTITDRGTFVYKQTKPVERKRLIGKLEKDEENNFLVAAERKRFNVLTASITYYKGVPGDKVVILVPIAADSQWAAVENVIKNK
jgi:hypothetical protein